LLLIRDILSRRSASSSSKNNPIEPSLQAANVIAVFESALFVTSVTYALWLSSVQFTSTFHREGRMNVNVGRTDQLIRIIVGVGVLSLLFFLKGDARLLGLVGIVPLATGLVGYCPLYSLLGLSTCPSKTKAA
jgi:hypothetical protein